MSQQSLRQASVRGSTGTTGTYEGDWHAMFTADGIADGTYNERLLAWINQRLSGSYTELNSAMAAMAVAEGAGNFQSIGAFSVFSPSSLFAASEQGVWYDPSDLSTLFQDTAGTTPVTAAGQSVARINDKSGRGNHAIQGTAAQQPTYQVDGNGKAYLSFDGSDDGLATSATIDMSGTDSLTAVCGLRKNSDAVGGVAFEFSANVTTDAGSFFLLAPSGAATNIRAASRGSATPVLATYSSTIAPVSMVATVQADISADSLIIRYNGAEVATGSTDQGSGNYGNYTLYVGRRNLASLPFNGRLYGLIIRGATSDAAQITSTETWMNARTGAY